MSHVDTVRLAGPGMSYIPIVYFLLVGDILSLVKILKLYCSFCNINQGCEWLCDTSLSVFKIHQHNNRPFMSWQCTRAKHIATPAQHSYKTWCCFHTEHVHCRTRINALQDPTYEDIILSHSFMDRKLNTQMFTDRRPIDLQTQLTCKSKIVKFIAKLLRLRASTWFILSSTTLQTPVCITAALKTTLTSKTFTRSVTSLRLPTHDVPSAPIDATNIIVPS